MGKPPPVGMGLVPIHFVKIIEPLAVGASPHRTILLDRASVRKPSTKVAFQRQVEPCQKNTGRLRNLIDNLRHNCLQMKPSTKVGFLIVPVSSPRTEVDR